MPNDLALEQSQYLKERGFEVVVGEPNRKEPFPYVSLQEKQPNLLSSEITYHHAIGLSTKTMNVLHPSTRGEDELVGIIEKFVGTNMIHDGRIFHTQPGKPIKIFVIDPAWQGVADTLVTKYN